MVDFTIEGIIGVIAQTFCGGSMTLAGLFVMLAFFFVCVVILANIRAPVAYALVPMMLLDIVFAAIGIVDSTVSFVIVILCAILMAKQTRDLVGGS